MSHSMTIRLGASHWDATVHSAGGDTTFDFRTMTKDQRRQWYAAFMSSVRTMLGSTSDRPLLARHRRRNRRAHPNGR